MKMSKDLGTLMLAVWLILYGVLSQRFVSINIPYSGDLLAVLAIVIGVLLLLRR